MSGATCSVGACTPKRRLQQRLGQPQPAHAAALCTIDVILPQAVQPLLHMYLHQNCFSPLMPPALTSDAANLSLSSSISMTTMDYHSHMFL